MIENRLLGRIPVVRDIVGAASRILRNYNIRLMTSNTELHRDIGTVSYAWWDKAYHGKQRGLEISALLLKPLVNKIAAWTFGREFKVKFEKKRKTQRFAKWLRKNYNQVYAAYRTSIKLGDGYLIVNPDTSITSVSPSCVFPILDQQDLSKQIGWVVIQEFTDGQSTSTRKQLIRDEFIYDNEQYRRTRTITEDGKRDRVERFSLPLSRVPIIHIANNPSENEMFGRPEGEALIQLLHRYGSLLDAALDGNEKQGRPTPVFSSLGSQREVDAFWKRHGTLISSEPDEDGTVEQYYVLNFDSDRAITLGGNAKFSWESPGSASQDTETLLGILFYLYVQHGEMPEWVLGNAITGSKASAEVQVDPLVFFIGMKRLFAEPWLHDLVTVACEMMSLSEPFMANDPEEVVEIVWPVLTRKDGQLILQSTQWAYDKRIIQKTTALDHLPIDVSDTDEEIRLAGEEERPELEDATQMQVINQRMNEDETVQFTGDDAEDEATNASGNKNGPDRSEA